MHKTQYDLGLTIKEEKTDGRLVDFGRSFPFFVAGLSNFTQLVVSWKFFQLVSKGLNTVES
jgi:hypothetical protein